MCRRLAIRDLMLFRKSNYKCLYYMGNQQVVMLVFVWRETHNKYQSLKQMLNN